MPVHGRMDHPAFFIRIDICQFRFPVTILVRGLLERLIFYKRKTDEAAKSLPEHSLAALGPFFRVYAQR